MKKIFTVFIFAVLIFSSFAFVMAEGEDEFCGPSLEGYCEVDSDCGTDGCTSQVCGNLEEIEDIVTSCVALECYSAVLYEVSCGCVNNKCLWAGENDDEIELIAQGFEIIEKENLYRILLEYGEFGLSDEDVYWTEFYITQEKNPSLEDFSLTSGVSRNSLLSNGLNLMKDEVSPKLEVFILKAVMDVNSELDELNTENNYVLQSFEIIWENGEMVDVVMVDGQFSCEIYWEGYVFDELSGDCELKSASGCSNPFEFETEDECFGLSVPSSCEDGCFYKESCVPFGYRAKGMYCEIDNEMVDQFEAEAVCDNNFECSSNLCIYNQCVSEGAWKKFLSWFGRIFG